MHHPYIALLRTKFYKIYRKLSKLINSGRFHTISTTRRSHLLKLYQRYHDRLFIAIGDNWKYGALSLSILLGLQPNIKAQDTKFTKSKDETPFDIPVVGYYAAPTFADIDADGDFDLFIGVQDSVYFFRNIGTPSEARFTPESSLGFSTPGYYQVMALIDIDGDGDLDAFIGDYPGGLSVYINEGSKHQPAFQSVSPTDYGLSEIISAENEVKPTFADIDGDGDFDLFVADEYTNMFFYENTGSPTSASFSLMESNLISGVLGTSSGTYYPRPYFADIDLDGDLDAFIGQFYGNTLLYRNYGTFTEATFPTNFPAATLGLVDVSPYEAQPSFVDIDGDGDLDAFIGDSYGKTTFFAGRTSFRDNFVELSDSSPLDLYRQSGGNSVLADIDNDGDIDVLYVDGTSNSVLLFANHGNSINASFGSVATDLNVSWYGSEDMDRLALADLDGDGDLDAFIGTVDSTYIRVLYNEAGTDGIPLFDPISYANLEYVNIRPNSQFSFVDIDDDGDMDCISSLGINNSITINKNYGDNLSPDFSTSGNYSIEFASRHISGAPAFIDIDDDGDLDMIFGGNPSASANVYYYTNNSPSSTSITFSSNSSDRFDDVSAAIHHISFADIDSDGDLDILGSNNSAFVLALNHNCRFDQQVNHFQVHQSYHMSSFELRSKGIINPGSEIEMLAGGEIHMEPGFEVKEGATLIADIGGCSELID